MLKQLSIILILAITYFLYDSTKPFYNGPVTDHFDGKQFHNYNPKDGTFSLGDVLKWQYYEFNENIKSLWPDEINDAPESLPPIKDRVYNGTKITFINHATTLIQTNGINIITDPIFSTRVSPLQWIGPKRYRKAGISLDDLPPIDYALISHDHYDHCDVYSLQELRRKFNTKIIAGLGMDKFLKGFGVKNVHTLDWWQKIQMQDLAINFVPVIHWSGRYGLLGNNRTLWGGFVIETQQGNIFFAGDTAFARGEVFYQIKEHFKDFAAALLPIGAYEPRWFMAMHHINPEEAVKIHRIIDPKHSIAIHYGCFALSTEGEGKPEEDLLSSIHKYKVQPSTFLILKHGESLGL